MDRLRADGLLRVVTRYLAALTVAGMLYLWCYGFLVLLDAIRHM